MLYEIIQDLPIIMLVVIPVVLAIFTQKEVKKEGGWKVVWNRYNKN